MTHVLLVDDDRWLADLYTDQLEQKKYTVSRAAHAYEALRILDETSIDIIVLDMLLPAVNGIGLLQELRSHDDLAAIPIIVTTSTNVTNQELAPYGVRAVLYKPKMRHNELAQQIRQVIGDPAV